MEYMHFDQNLKEDDYVITDIKGNIIKPKKMMKVLRIQVNKDNIFHHKYALGNFINVFSWGEAGKGVNEPVKLTKNWIKKVVQN